jgi:DNA-dependent protein kinase catalytic subunit
LGIIARFYPDIAQETQVQRLKRWCFDNLSDQTSNNKEIENTTAQGYLSCLDSLIYRKDIVLIPKNSQDSEKLFNILVKIWITTNNASRSATPIAALALFYHHARLFSNLLLPNSEKLYDCLYSWAHHHNPSVCKHGLHTFEEFIKEV